MNANARYSPLKVAWKRRWPIALLIALLTVSTTTSLGQEVANPKQGGQANEEDVADIGCRYGEPVIAKWRVTSKMRGRAFGQSVFATLPVPNDWPEQSVTLVEENIPSGVGAVLKYRTISHNVRQMMVQIPSLPANETVSVAVTVEVATREILEPEDKSRFRIPKKSHKVGKTYLGVSPFVNFRDSKLRRFTNELVGEESSAWKKVEKIYDWVRDNIEQQDGKVASGLAAFRSKRGCNEDRIYLFVSMCRAAKIPARIVFANQFNYAEFMLTDEEGKKAYWFPANINGVYELGSLAEPKIILQKGHYIKVPEKKEMQKYVAEFAAVKAAGPKPQVIFHREQLDEDDDDDQ